MANFSPELEFTREHVRAWVYHTVSEKTPGISGDDATDSAKLVLQTILINHYVREWSDYDKCELLQLLREAAMHGNGSQPIHTMKEDELLTEVMDVCHEFAYETMGDFVCHFCAECDN